MALLSQSHLILLFLLLLPLVIAHQVKPAWTLFAIAPLLLYSAATDVLGWQALPMILLFALSCWGFWVSTQLWQKWCTGLLVFLLCIAMLLHLVPGFNNPLIVEGVQVSAEAEAYSKYLNLDKSLVAIFLLMWVVPRASKLTNIGLKHAIGVWLLAVLVCLVIANVTGLVRFEPKLSSLLWLWAVTNLFITCYAEEAFFRGFVQQRIYAGLSKFSHANMSTIVLSGLLFGLAHFPAGITYTIIASILGVAFAYAYVKTNNIYVPIMGHFGFNLIHFCFFSYPFLA